MDDQLVIDIGRLSALFTELGGLGVRTEPGIETHAGLGLALVTLVPGWPAGTSFESVDDLVVALRSTLGPGELGRNQPAGAIIPPGYSFLSTAGGVTPLDKIPHALGDPVPFQDSERDWAELLTRFGATQQVPRRQRLGNGVLVGILDTPLHRPPLLAEPVFADPPPTDPGYPARPVQSHALFVASVIRRYAPGAGLVVRTVPGLDEGHTTSWETAKQLMTFLELGVDILNVSLGGQHAEAPLELVRAVGRLSRQLLVVAAAGNYPRPGEATNPPLPTFPAAIDGVFAVGARTEKGELASFSPHGGWVSATAPGVNVPGTSLVGELLIQPDDFDRKIEDLETTSAGEAGWADSAEAAAGAVGIGGGLLAPAPKPFDGRARWSGTSFAAAAATGAIAAKLSALRGLNPAATVAQARAAVLADNDSVRPYAP